MRQVLPVVLLVFLAACGRSCCGGESPEVPGPTEGSGIFEPAVGDAAPAPGPSPSDQAHGDPAAVGSGDGSALGDDEPGVPGTEPENDAPRFDSEGLAEAGAEHGAWAEPGVDPNAAVDAPDPADDDWGAEGSGDGPTFPGYGPESSAAVAAQEDVPAETGEAPPAPPELPEGLEVVEEAAAGPEIVEANTEIICQPGDTCDWICATGGGCIFRCLAGSQCTATCDDPGCVQRCESGASCHFTCMGGNCVQVSRGNAAVRMTCDGGYCEQSCRGDGLCDRSCYEGCRANGVPIEAPTE